MRFDLTQGHASVDALVAHFDARLPYIGMALSVFIVFYVAARIVRALNQNMGRVAGLLWTLANDNELWTHTRSGTWTRRPTTGDAGVEAVVRWELGWIVYPRGSCTTAASERTASLVSP